MLSFYVPRIPPTAGMYHMWHGEMEKYELPVIEAMWKHLKEYTVAGDQFPSTQKCMALAESIRFNMFKEEEARKKRQEAEDTRRFFSEEGKDDFGRKAIRNINALLSGTITRKEFICAGEALGMNMHQTAEFYQSRGADMNKPAEVR